MISALPEGDFFEKRSLLHNADFRSKSRHAKNFTAGIVDISRIKIF
jgi:hypothetical protein